MLSLKSTATAPLKSAAHYCSLSRLNEPQQLRRWRPSSGRPAAIRAVISSDDKNVITVSPSPSSAAAGLQKIPPSSSPAEAIDVRVVLTIRNKLKRKLADKIEEKWEYFINGVGQGILVQLVSEEIDPATKSVRRSAEAAVRGWLPKPSSHPSIVEYAADFTVQSGFGRPGAVIITNLHDKEFHLMGVVVHGFADGPVFFPANTWIHSLKDSTEKRIIFSNQACLPSHTPPGLKDLRQHDLIQLRGDGRGERKTFERIYDYAVYNDLGNPDKDVDLARPVVGGEERPYPRRCRTGRPPAKSDPTAESRVEKPHHVYVPRDETFEEIKQNTFSSGALRALLHNLIPAMMAALSSTDSQFECFSDIDRLYKDGVVLKDDGTNLTDRFIIPSLLKNAMSIGEKLLKYDIPSIISRDRFSWLRDNEFARQTLAGVNPVSIERLQEFPILSKLDPAVFGPPESAITRELLEHELNGMSLEEAMVSNRLFIIDYHDLLLPFIRKINSLKGRKAYASRTIFFLTDTKNLRPVAIELSLPPTPSTPSRKKVYTHGHDATAFWIWKLAKAHVCSNDAGVHQLVSHWLRTHACMEPYIIASHRQLSSMHPIFKLLHPHMRYTMEINALARQSLINGGGIIEMCFSPEKYSLEVSSVAYKSMWRFDMEALPADLLRRGMAVEDPSMPCGIKLVIEDYPYAADGLLMWSAIEDWVRDYVNHFYPDSSSITSDVELQAWWDEIKNKGHHDKKDEPWWPSLNTREDLTRILTIMIWTASGQHAAINFGQYPFGGYMPNRPTLMKKLIPQEDEEAEYEKFLMNPQGVFLSSVPSQLQATQIMAVQDTLSTHSPDEEYVGQVREPHWTNDGKIMSSFEKFSARLEEIEAPMDQQHQMMPMALPPSQQQQWPMMVPPPAPMQYHQAPPAPLQYLQAPPQTMWGQQPSQITPPQPVPVQAPPPAHYQAQISFQAPAGPAQPQPGSVDEIKTLWIGDLQYWMDENYVSSCFAATGEVVSVKLIRNKQTGVLEGYGFIDFATHATAEKVLQTYNGTMMPNIDQNFRLNWASFGAGERRGDDGADYTIFVGDLAADVTDYVLQETFRSNYPSVKGAKVLTDRATGRSKGYGFVRFGDVNEQTRAMTEMNGMYCSSRAMRICPATTKRTVGGQQQYSAKASYQNAQGQGTQSENDPDNTTIFVGGLDSNVSEDELRRLFSTYGELVHVKIPFGKRCGFVQYANRTCAEEAKLMLNGTLVGSQNIRLSWGHSPNKQQQQQDPNQWNGNYSGYGQGYDTYGYQAPPQDPNMYAYGGYPGYPNYQQQQVNYQQQQMNYQQQQ